MKKQVTSLVLALVLLISCLSFISVAAVDNSIAYLQDYSQFEIPDGEPYVEYPYSSTGSSWNLNAAGSWAYEWLINDEGEKDGNYFVIAPASQNIHLLTTNPTSGTANGKTALTTHFTLDFSFKTLDRRPDRPGTSGGLNSEIRVNIFPYASTASNGREGEGHIITIPVGGRVKVINDTTETEAAEFPTEKEVWYDARVVTDLSPAVPVYSVYMKKSADEEYTLLAENISFPKSGDYSKGLGVHSVLTVMANYATTAVDDIKIEYYEKKVAPSASAVFASGSGTVGKSLTGIYKYAGYPAEGESLCEWLVSDTKDGKFEPISGAETTLLTIGDSLKDKFVKFRVTPVNKDGEEGSAVESPAVKIIKTDREYGIDNLNNDPGELKVGFIGGSITYGTGASKKETRYATRLINDYFKKKFPNKTVTEINTGIGGTPSELGLMRLNRELSSQAPDVVFVEYAVNDNSYDKAKAQRQYEGIVRQLLKLPKQPVVIALYTCTDALDETTAMYQQEVVDYYGMGSVNFIKYVKEHGGADTWKTLSGDGVHPNDAGYALYSEIVIDAFDKEFNNYFKTYDVPEKIMSDHEFKNTMIVPFNETERVSYEGNWIIDAGDSQKDSYSGFAHWGNGAVVSKTAGDKVTFKFKGTSIGLWGHRGTSYGSASYSIDNGKYTGTINATSPYNMAFPIFFLNDLDDGEHTIVIETKGGGTDNLFSFGYFFTDDDYALKPNAENVKITGPMEFGKTLGISYDVAGECDEFTYQWLFAEEEFGTYSHIPGATDKEWKITTTYANKYICAEVTAKDGNTSRSASTQIPGTAETVVYQQTYEERELGKSSFGANYSSWFHNMAGSYAYVYLLDDSYSVNGKYLAVRSVNNTTMKMLTTYPSKGNSGKQYFNRDFIAEFSFNNFSSRDDLDGGAGGAEFTVCMWPASLGTDGRDDLAVEVGKLVKIAPEKTFAVYNNGVETAVDESLIPARGEWYDLRIVTDLDVSSDIAPTYDVYIKKSSDKDYVLAAEKVSYPKDYSYSSGISTYAFIDGVQNASYLAYDNVKLSYPPLEAAPPSAANLTLEYDKMATGETVSAKYDFEDPNSDEEKDSAFVWYRGDSEDGKFDVIDGATSKTYKLSEADENKYIKYQVTPRAAVEPYDGEPVTSDAFMGAFAPEADNIRLKEGAIVGRTIQCEFDYSDANGDKAGTHKYQWYVDDATIDGATGDSITVKPEYSGKNLYVEVTPVSSEKPYDGKVLKSGAFPVGGSNSAPSADDVKIQGNAVVGVAVNGTYKFSDPDGDTEGASHYRWYISDDNLTYTQIENQEGISLYLNETYQNKYVKFEVVPVDSGSLEGVPVKSEGLFIEGKLANELYVSLSGDDENDGSFEKPFKTLTAARDAIRKMNEEGSLPAGGITVYIRGGEYALSETFEFTEKDSGTADKPITWRNYRDEKVTISGKHNIDFSKFAPVSDETMKNKLRSEDARSKVMVADLADIGLEDYEGIEKTGQSSTTEPMLFFNGEVMSLSRYPNSGTIDDWPLCYYSSTDSQYTGTQEGYWSRENQGVPGTCFIVKYKDPVISTWSHNSDQWFLYGYLKYYWAPEAIPVTVDSSKQFIKAKVQTVYGVENGTAGRPFMIKNVYEEIDEPGEWYIDTVNKKMYIYPSTNNPSDFYMSKLEGNLINLNNTDYVTFRGLELCGGKNNGVGMTDCDYAVIDNCEIYGFQVLAYRMAGGTNSGIKNSHVHHLGAGGMYYEKNGDIENQIKSNNFVTNCEIHDFQLLSTSYTAAVYIDFSVGNLVNYNEIYNSEHCAIRFEGPLNVIEYNVFHDVVRSATDMAAIYTGRSLRTIGNVIRYNYFYDVGGNTSDHGNQAIFFDDGCSGNDVYCNVFGPSCGTRVFKNYGGMDTDYYNNIFIDNPFIGDQANWDWDYWKNCASGDYLTGEIVRNSPLYREQYPWVQKLYDGTFSETDYIKTNEVTNNLFFNISKPLNSDYMRVRAGYENNPYVQKDNIKISGNTDDNKAYFEDYENGNYNLTDAAYAKIREKIPDFMDVPFIWMGMQAVSNALPTAENAIINGMQTMSVTYDYVDAERDLEGKTQFAWYVSDSKDGVYTAIEGANAEMYEVVPEYYGKYIKASVTPVDEYGVAGASVMTEPVFVVAGVDSLKALVDNIQSVLDKAEAGDDCGEYPAQAIADLKSALENAKAVLDGTDTETGIVDAAKVLDESYEVFKNQQVTTLVSDTEYGTVKIPSDLRRLDLTLNNVTGKIIIDGVDTLPATTVKATVGGVDVTLEIPAGTKSGVLLEALDSPGADIVGNHYLSVKIGNPGEAYNEGIKVTVSGGANKALYAIKDGSAISLSGENTDGNKQFSITESSEILLTELKEASKDTTLTSVSIDGKELSTFRVNRLTYNVTVSSGASVPVVSAVAADANSSVEIVQADSVPGTAVITVSAQDKTVTPVVYTINFDYAGVADDDSDDNSASAPSYGGSYGGGTYGGSSSAGGFYSGVTITPSATVSENVFSDVEGHWAKNDIMALYSVGIVSGVTKNTFEPERSITRAEFAALIARALKLPEAEGIEFSDVTADKWYAKEVAKASGAGLIVGFDGKFRPDDNITREEMAVIIMKAYEYAGLTVPEGSVSKFSDSQDISEWAIKYVGSAVEAELISGITEDMFVPKANATRAQVASVIRRLLNKIS